CFLGAECLLHELEQSGGIGHAAIGDHRLITIGHGLDCFLHGTASFCSKKSRPTLAQDWKKLTLVRQWNVVLMFAFEREVRARGQPREGAEVVDEVGLIEVAAVDGDVRPVHVSQRMDGPDDLLETLYPREELGRHPYFMSEALDEAALGHPNCLRHLGDR